MGDRLGTAGVVDFHFSFLLPYRTLYTSHDFVLIYFSVLGLPSTWMDDRFSSHDFVLMYFSV